MGIISHIGHRKLQPLDLSCSPVRWRRRRLRRESVTVGSVRSQLGWPGWPPPPTPRAPHPGPGGDQMEDGAL